LHASYLNSFETFKQFQDVAGGFKHVTRNCKRGLPKMQWASAMADFFKNLFEIVLFLFEIGFFKKNW